MTRNDNFTFFKVIIFPFKIKYLKQLLKFYFHSFLFQASQQCCVSTQTRIVRNNILNEYEIRKLEKEAKLSDDVEELRENILLLLLAVEEKDKELSEVKQSLLVVQEDLKKALTTTSSFDKVSQFYFISRFYLH